MVLIKQQNNKENKNKLEPNENIFLQRKNENAL